MVRQEVGISRTKATLLILALFCTRVYALQTIARIVTMPGGPCRQGDAACFNYYGAKYVNAIRFAAKAPLLKLGSSEMLKHAVQHSRAMQARDKMFHEDIRKINKSGKYKCGEFLSAAMVLKSKLRSNNPAKQCVSTWGRSLSHKTVINFAHHKDIALGVIVDDNRYIWCTLLFAVNTYPQCKRPGWAPPKPTATATAKPIYKPTPKPYKPKPTKKPIVSKPKPSKKPYVAPTKKPVSKTVYRFIYRRILLNYNDGTKHLVVLICFGDTCRYCIDGKKAWCYSSQFSRLIDMYLKSKYN